MSQWTLNLFDRFELLNDDTVVASFGARKEALLLALVALNAERAVPRDEICEALWSGRALPRARRNFSYTLSILRKQLAEHGKPDCLYVGARSVQLNPSVHTDRARFEELLGVALRGGGERRRELLEQALALYGGGLLPEIETDWVVSERARLSRLAAAARRALQELVAGEGALAGAAGELRGHAFGVGAGDVDAAAQEAATLTADGAGEKRRGPAAGENGSRASDGGANAEPTNPATTEVTTPRRKQRTRRRRRDDAPEKIVAWAETMTDRLNGPDRLSALDEVAARWSAVEAAVAHFRAQRDYRQGGRLVAALWRYWYHRARPEDGRLHAETFLAFGDWPPGAPRARLLHAAGTLAHKTDDQAMAYRRLQHAVQAWADVDDDAGLLSSLANLAMVARVKGEDDAEMRAEAGKRFAEALRIADRLEEDAHRTTLLLGAAQLAIEEEDRADALALLARRQVVVERTGDRAAEASTWSHVAAALLLEPVDVDGAFEATERARVLYHEVGDVVGECYALRLMGYAAQKRAELGGSGEVAGAGRDGAQDGGGEGGGGRGDLAEAERWYRASLDLAKETADAWSVEEARRALAAVGNGQEWVGQAPG